MRGRALTDDVSIGELMSMRGDGMSNSQIAESLGVSVSTIYAAIGKGGATAQAGGHAGTSGKGGRAI